jgi:glycosidase
MNYPFMESLHNFWLDNQTSRELMYAMNRCFTLYPRQVNDVLFNFLDTHDTMRAPTRCGKEAVFRQQLAFLMTMPGSACIYYGTEISLPGGDDPDNRRPMPWDRIEAGEYEDALADTRAIIALRKTWPQLRRGEIRWQIEDSNPRLICFRRCLEDHPPITVYLNAQTTTVTIPATGKLLYERKLEGKKLRPGGIAIILEDT